MSTFKIYKLIGSDKIKSISTYIDQFEAHIDIIYTDDTGLSVSESILSRIDSMVQAQLIGNKLAMVLYSDFAHLLQGKSISFPDSSLITPFICTDLSKEISINSDTPFDTAKQDKVMEEANLQKALSNSLLTLKPIAVAQHTQIEKVNENFLKTSTTNSEDKTPLQIYSSFSNYNTELQVIKSHQIGEFICEFMHDNKGILFYCSTCEEDKETLRISQSNKKDILNCHDLVELVQILRTIEHSDTLVAVIEHYLESAKNTELCINSL